MDENCRHGREYLWRQRRKDGTPAKSGPHRDPAVQPSGEALTDLQSGLGLGEFDKDVTVAGDAESVQPFADPDTALEDQPLSVGLPGVPSETQHEAHSEANPKEEGKCDSETPPEFKIHDDDAEHGFEDNQSLITIRERRVAVAREVLGLKPKKELKDQSDQADAGAAEDWRTMDVAKVLRSLHNPDESVARKALQRLHLRWWHCTAEQLTQTLRAAGAPPKALSLISSVVNACQVCRTWKRPGNKNVLSVSPSERFNEDAQFDLLFYESLLEPSKGRQHILHVIDACLRWSATTIVPNKDETTLTTAISSLWISIYGPMHRLTLDEETTMRGRAATDWAVQNQVTLNFKAPRQKAWLVERHNEILRQELHRTELQLKKVSLITSFAIGFVHCHLRAQSFHRY